MESGQQLVGRKMTRGYGMLWISFSEGLVDYFNRGSVVENPIESTFLIAHGQSSSTILKYQHCIIPVI